MSTITTITLPEGYQLTLTTDAVSSGHFYELHSSSQGTGFTAIAASSTTSLGPFAIPKQYAVVSETGLIQISQAPTIGGLANLDSDTDPELGGDLDLNGFNIDFPTTPNIADVIDDDTFATASATTLATSESIKAYVDANTGPEALDELTDVILTAPVNGQLLRYNGTDWVNSTPAAADMDWTDPVDNNIIPDSNATRDLGSTANRFDELFVDDIIVTNLVDGRDVSVDGAKLDGIEAGAQVNDPTINTRVLHVDKSGNDGTGTGSEEAPYLTIQAAINAAAGANSSNKYVVKVGIGTYSETLILNPYVNLDGAGQEVTLVSSASAVTLSAAGRTEISNMSFSGGGGFNIDSDAFASGTVTTLRDCTVTGPVTASGRGPGSDYFQLRTCFITGNVSLTGLANTVFDSTIVGNLTTAAGGTELNGFGELSETSFSTSYVIDVTNSITGADLLFFQAYDARIDGDLTLTGTGVTFEADATSWPIGTISTSGSPTSTRRTTSNSVLANRTATNYTATDVSVKGHLDGIDTKLGTMPTNLDSLTDVVITAPANTEVLKYNGTNWVNAADSGGASTLNDLTDVVITSPANLDLLSYNGTNWVNEAIESTTIATGDLVLIQDISASNAYKYDTVANLLALGGGSADVVKISTNTFSNTATSDFTGLSSTYKAYFVVFENVTPVDDGPFCFMRVSTDNGSTYVSASSSYNFTASFFTRAGTSGNTKDSDIATTVIALSGEGVGNQSSEGIDGIVNVFNPSDSAAYMKIRASMSSTNSAGNISSVTVAGNYLATTAVNAIRFYFGTGNINSGSMTLYGVK